MIIEFDFEGRDEQCAFFALYAGLRMYKELKNKVATNNAFSIAGAEAYCMLEDLKEQYPKQYWESAAEFEQVYK